MTTVFLDAVFKLFFFFFKKNRPWHGPTTENCSDEFPDGWPPSNHSTCGVCECKHAISNNPQRKKSHVERSEERGGHGMPPKREMRCPGNMFRTMVIDSFCSVRCGTILLKPNTGTVYSSSAQFWVLPIQKMSGSRGSLCINRAPCTHTTHPTQTMRDLVPTSLLTSPMYTAHISRV